MNEIITNDLIQLTVALAEGAKTSSVILMMMFTACALTFAIFKDDLGIPNPVACGVYLICCVIVILSAFDCRNQCDIIANPVAKIMKDRKTTPAILDSKTMKHGIEYSPDGTKVREVIIIEVKTTTIKGLAEIDVQPKQENVK
jgi:hypothetical protein